MKVELFKIQMSMYRELLMSKKEIERQIDQILYEYGGVKGLDYSKEHSDNPYYTDQNLIIMSEMLIEPQKQLDYVIYAIKQLEPVVQENLNRLPSDIKKAVKLIFWEKKTYHEVGKLIGYSDHGLWARIEREVKKI